VKDSQQVLEWIAEGEAKGEAKGRLQGKAETLLHILARPFPPGAPAEIVSAIHAMPDVARLEAWVDVAMTAESLEGFRQTAGL
jgi:hypothetical protein